MHLAAAKNNPIIVELLLDRGADVQAQDKYHDTIYERSRDKDGRKSVSRQTPLHVAAEKSHNPAVIELLLDRGADASLRDGEGRLPVDLAEKNERIKLHDVYWRLHDAKF